MTQKLNKKSCNSIACKSLVVAGSALVPVLALAVDPQPIEAGPFNIVPTISFDARDTDNMFLSNTDEVSSKLYIVSPRVELTTESGGNTFSLAGQVDEANYSATDEDDYTDWRVGGDAHLQMNVRNSLDLNAGFFRTRETRGTGFSQGGFLPTSPDRYEESTWGGRYQFGTKESFGRLELSVNSYDKSYFNNRLTTRFRDREDFGWTGAFYLNISPRTDVFVEYSQRDVDYTTDPVVVAGAGDSLDSDETYAYVGVSWEISGATTGSVKIGQGDKEFDDSDRRDQDTSAWEASILWEPLTYSVFNFTASKQYGESTGIGDALETTNFAIDWQHAWSDSLSTSVSWFTSDDDYTGSVRADNIDALSLRMDYSVRRWVDVFVAFSRDKRDSNFGSFNYTQNIASFGFQASL
jgi:hypothetical protein